ncbi:MAG: endolytic transglycosylase MltG, partial [Deinococcus sp.]|nr:endolytic transglycosylase MltG [Deinococcus sp.]
SGVKIRRRVYTQNRPAQAPGTRPLAPPRPEELPGTAPPRRPPPRPSDVCLDRRPPLPRPQPPLRRAAPRRSSGALVVFLFLFLILMAAGGAFYIQYLLSPTHASPVELEIQSGSARSIARQLTDAGLIRRPEVLLGYLWVTGQDRALRAGLYDFTGEEDVAALVEKLQQGGRPRVFRVTIPEGFRASQIGQRLAEVAPLAEPLDVRAWTDDAKDANTPRPAGIPPGSLEGFLFPATYTFPVKTTFEEMRSAMLERFLQEVTPEVQQRLQAIAAREAISFSIPEWVILASIVQSEAGSEAEMPIIAGVFWNRLRRPELFGCRNGVGIGCLQSDATVAYGARKYLPQLVAADLDEDTPWNTYTRPGLPESAISNPGHAALQAVLAYGFEEPEHQFFYFYHRPNSEFCPSRTLQEHNAAIQGQRACR